MTSTLNNSTNLVIENRKDIRNANIKQEEIIDHHKFRNGTHSNAHMVKCTRGKGIQTQMVNTNKTRT